MSTLRAGQLRSQPASQSSVMNEYLSTMHENYFLLVKNDNDEDDQSYDARKGSPIMVAYDSHSRNQMAHYVVQKRSSLSFSPCLEDVHRTTLIRTGLVPRRSITSNQSADGRVKSEFSC